MNELFHKLTRNNFGKVYILPTRYGVVLCAVLVVMFLAGASYANNLVYLLTFVIFALFVASLIQTNFNLKGLSVVSVRVSNGHVNGTNALIRLYIRNGTRESKAALFCSIDKHELISFSQSNSQSVSEGAQACLEIKINGNTRGKQYVSRLKLTTIYPFGLWRSWRWVNVDANIYLYPEIIGKQPLPRVTTDNIGSSIGSLGSDDYSEHKLYQVGESFRHIDWKARARGNPLLVKKFERGDSGVRILDWDDIQIADREGRLSQMAKWINECSVKSEEFGVLMPGNQFFPGAGSEHVEKCLKALAMYERDLDAAS